MANSVRRPLIQAVVNGVVLSGVLSVSVESNNHFGADRFRLRLAAQAVSLASLQLPGSRVTIQMAVDGTWVDLITGVVDTASLDPISGWLELEGRDLAALLIEAQTSETFSNQTASEVVSIVAGRHGLNADVDRTSTAVGRYYQSERDRVTLGQFARASTEWDLLAFLARQEGFDLYLHGTTIRFGLPSSSEVHAISRHDCLHLKLDHCLSLARPIAVSVKSWSAKTATASVVTAESGGQGPLWSRTISRPNLTPDDAGKLAAQTIADLKRHEWSAQVLMPGELLMTARSQIVLSGTQSPWDRTFSVGQLSRHIDERNGFTQRVLLQGIA